MQTSKRILVGLGNPDEKYSQTRHNAGVLFLESLGKIDWEAQKEIYIGKHDDLVLVKSKAVYMNESGKMIEGLKYLKYDLSNLYIVHDDLDLKLGEYKIQHAKGPEVHGGINDIERVVGKEFWRIRIGIDNRGIPRIPGEEYVLQRFTDEELNRLQSVFDEIAQGINRGEGTA